MELNETILIKTEVPTCACTRCFYNQIDEGDTKPTCCRPAHEALVDDCFEDVPNGKYYIFVEQTKTK